MKRLVQLVWLSPTLMTWASLSIRIGGLALLLPLVLTRLQTQEILVWQLLSTITILINWTDFGFSPTFSRVISFARGSGTLLTLQTAMPDTHANINTSSQPLRIAEIMATHKVVYRRLICITMVLTAVGGTAVLVHPIENLPRPNDGWIAWAFTALACQLVLANGSNISILTGFDKIAGVRRLDAAIGALQLGATSIVTVAGGDLPTIVGCYSLWQLPLFIFNRISVARLLKSKDHEHDARFNRDIFRVIWRSAWRSGVGTLMSAGIIQTSGIVYALIANAADAAGYLLALRIITAISQIAQAPFYSKLPAMGRLRGEGRSMELLHLATRGMAFAHWTYVAGALTFTIGAPFFLLLIGSSVKLPNYELCALIALAFFVERYSAMHIQLYSLTHHIVWHIANGVTGILMILFFVALYPIVGPISMPTSMLLAYTFYFSWYASTLSIRSLGVHRYDFEKATALAPGLMLIMTLCGYWFFVK